MSSASNDGAAGASAASRSSSAATAGLAAGVPSFDIARALLKDAEERMPEAYRKSATKPWPICGRDMDTVLRSETTILDKAVKMQMEEWNFRDESCTRESLRVERKIYRRLASSAAPAIKSAPYSDGLDSNDVSGVRGEGSTADTTGAASSNAGKLLPRPAQGRLSSASHSTTALLSASASTSGICSGAGGGRSAVHAAGGTGAYSHFSRVAAAAASTAPKSEKGKSNLGNRSNAEGDDKQEYFAGSARGGSGLRDGAASFLIEEYGSEFSLHSGALPVVKQRPSRQEAMVQAFLDVFRDDSRETAIKHLEAANWDLGDATFSMLRPDSPGGETEGAVATGTTCGSPFPVLISSALVPCTLAVPTGAGEAASAAPACSPLLTAAAAAVRPAAAGPGEQAVGAGARRHGSKETRKPDNPSSRSLPREDEKHVATKSVFGGLRGVVAKWSSMGGDIFEGPEGSKFAACGFQDSPSSPRNLQETGENFPHHDRINKRPRNGNESHLCSHQGCLVQPRRSKVTGTGRPRYCSRHREKGMPAAVDTRSGMVSPRLGFKSPTRVGMCLPRGRGSSHSMTPPREHPPFPDRGFAWQRLLGKCVRGGGDVSNRFGLGPTEQLLREGAFADKTDYNAGRILEAKACKYPGCSDMDKGEKSGTARSLSCKRHKQANADKRLRSLVWNTEVLRATTASNPPTATPTVGAAGSTATAAGSAASAATSTVAAAAFNAATAATAATAASTVRAASSVAILAAASISDASAATDG